ncbi:MAG: Kazal-type serine protease inhibitor [Candidatus Gracilibacteria bacterium]|nr:Kazal-type serine protease inhibitor [Candidatus Gracilibacteria bacterium]MDD2908140.1 Kazal-type serine protease inhibitor [Candidatus Gracilibacteria bacterium]
MKFIKKFFVIILAVIFIGFLFIYRAYNVKRVQEIKDSIPTETKQDIVCEDSYKPVCGEDKKTYSNECVATRINDVSIAHTGECIEEIINTGSENMTGSGIGESNLGETQDSSGEIINTEDREEIIVPEIKEETVSPDYYKNLRSQCDNSSCCLASVDTMENGNYKESPTGQCSSGYTQDMLKCTDSYKWCIKSPITTSNTGAIENSTGTVNGQKVLNYSNSNFNYGFSIPANSYYSGYGAQEGANHTVGISTSSGITNFSSSEVKVYYFKSKILPELEDSSYGMYKDTKNGKTYIELNGNSFIIEGTSGTDNIVNMIIKTIYAK